MPAPTALKPPPLEAGQHVIVRTVHIGMIPGTVDVVGDRSVTVVLTVRDDRFKRLLGHDIFVELSSGRGIYRHNGKLKADREGTLTIELTGEVERIQRREFVRVDAHEPAPTVDLAAENVQEVAWWTPAELASPRERLAPLDLGEVLRTLTP